MPTKFIFSILLLNASEASACALETYSGESRKIEVCYDDKRKATLTSSCLSSVKCWATESLKKATKPSKTSSYGANPGSTICRELGGVVLILSDDNGNETSFCEGPDKSVVDLNALASAAENLGPS